MGFRFYTKYYSKKHCTKLLTGIISVTKCQAHSEISNISSNIFRSYYLLHVYFNKNVIGVYLSPGKHVRAINTPLTPNLYRKTGVCGGILFFFFGPNT